MSSEALVTVICTTYNHEKYIRDALDGFLLQMTNFPVKYIIHDDASTDSTANIIREYDEKNPGKFFTILQKENMRSRKIPIFQTYIAMHVEGKYIAYCEGDDFWIAPQKLQKMVEYLEENPECSCCCHAYNKIRANTKELLSINRCKDANGILSAEDLIMYRRPPQLCAQVFRREVVEDVPEFTKKVGVGDYTKNLIALNHGYVFYIDEVLSSYRVSSDGSWTQRVYSNAMTQNQHWERICAFLEKFDIFTDGKYHNVINKKLDDIHLNMSINSRDYKTARNNPRYQFLPKTTKIEINIGCVNPFLATWLKNIYRGIKYGK